jgi:hypothetical protein
MEGLKKKSAHMMIQYKEQKFKSQIEDFIKARDCKLTSID